VAARIADAAADAMAEKRARIAAKLVDLLILHHVATARKAADRETPPGREATLGIDSIGARLRAWSEDVGDDPTDEIADVVVELGARSCGIILYDPQTHAARFNVRAASAPEVAAFNAALPLIRRFDATLGVVGEAAELGEAIARLGRAMESAVEAGMRNRAALSSAGQEFGAVLSAEQQRTFADFSAIAEAGPLGLIAAGADAEQSAKMAATLSDHDILIALGAALPRIRAMREYLESMGLHGQLEDDPRRDPLLARIETDCKLLLVAINAGLHAKGVATLDALESRFQRFKWTYVPHYRAAHEQWRQEMERAARLASDCAQHLAALRRLNSITALGPSEGSDLAAQFATLERRVTPCTLEGPLAPEITPCCPRCNYVIDTPSPREALNDLFARIRRALEAKLAVLSQNAIARLIQEHDHTRQLEGFLRIIQAAQTDALIRVLDDMLTRYLVRLLYENVATLASGEPIRSAVRSLRAAPLRGRAHRQTKMPRDRGD
jgi:hypothetical protein